MLLLLTRLLLKYLHLQELTPIPAKICMESIIDTCLELEPLLSFP